MSAAAAATSLRGPDASLLDLVDDVLRIGVSADGEIVLGLAGVDLVYLRLALLLAGADRCFPPTQRRRSLRPKAARAR